MARMEYIDNDHTHKLLLINERALTAKYGADLSLILAALDQLTKADADRGLNDMVLAIDDAGMLAHHGVAAVTDGADPVQAKTVIDALYRALTPDYIVLIGSSDVVPHQPLINPMPGDGDPVVPSDLPYACEHPYSTDPTDFVAPTRVVGRVPDVTGAGDPAYLVGLLDRAAAWTSAPRAAYDDGFTVSAAVWDGSTRLSARALYGNGASVELVPPDGPQWPNPALDKLTHFFNCHGASADPHFYGQQGNNYPIAHDSAWLAGRVRPGTVVAAECCYGAELYDPADAQGAPPICGTYLDGGAYGFFGSTTIAYGPTDRNANADLLARYFLEGVLSGASLGRATLQARQRFVHEASVVDPADLKTLAQFVLLGDPSVQPVDLPAGKSAPVAHGMLALATSAVSRAARRSNLFANGLALADATAVTRATGEAPDRGLIRQLLDLADADPGSVLSASSFTVTPPAITQRVKAFGLAHVLTPPNVTVHVVVGRPEGAGDGRATIETVAGTFAVIAREVHGEVVAWRRLDAR